MVSKMRTGYVTTDDRSFTDYFEAITWQTQLDLISALFGDLAKQDDTVTLMSVAATILTRRTKVVSIIEEYDGILLDRG